jgi:hypothetical protein
MLSVKRSFGEARTGSRPGQHLAPATPAARTAAKADRYRFRLLPAARHRAFALL